MVLPGLFILAVVIQLVYALYFFTRILFLPLARTEPGMAHEPVSIIICAKNEAANLKKNLPAILAQRYQDSAGGRNYEVIVVNDASTDNTAEILSELQAQFSCLKIATIPHDAPRSLPGKKYALSIGVANVTHHWLLLTDADCAPARDTWLAQMVVPLGDGKELVAGYGGYNEAAGLLNAFIRWETLHTFLQYSTYILAGKPYMAVGRNMACTKDALEKAQRSVIWGVLPSGDDDLLVRVAATPHNTAVVCDTAAFTWSDAKATWREWAVQKQRHMSTGKYYKGGIKLLLGAYGTSHAAMWVLFIVLMFTPFQKAVLLAMGARCIVYWALWVVTGVKLQSRRIIYLFPLFDIGWMVYNFAFLPYITWKNKQHWK